MPLPDVLGSRLTGIWTLATRGTDRRPKRETKRVNSAKLVAVAERKTHVQFLAVYEWDHQHVQEKGDGGDAERQ